MIDVKRKRLNELEKVLRDEKESLAITKSYYLEAKEKVEEIEVLIKSYKDTISEAIKHQERKEYKEKECGRCELGIYGGCMSEIDDVLECKALQKESDEGI